MPLLFPSRQDPSKAPAPSGGWRKWDEDEDWDT